MSADDQAVESTRDPQRPTFGRRILLAGAGTAAAAWLARPYWKAWTAEPQSVFIARHQRYDGPLTQTIRDALSATAGDLNWFAGRRVLLKPNLVEPTRAAPHMTTDPRIVVAAAEAFLQLGADVVVGEAPGHVRDTEMALAESGLAEAMTDARLQFADLNYDLPVWTPNAGGASKLKGFYFPRAVVEADVVVSLPKLKTHHWVGMTAALKNLYGVLPGIKYGWPKNVLHHAGIPQTVFDINASLPRTLTIVDGIACMQGDGPIMGSRKDLGLIIVGANLTAVDATCARIMGLAPERISYLQLAQDRLGPLRERQIVQRGERWQSVADPFEILDRPHLRSLQQRESAIHVS